APATLAAIHVYFPDPWPKARHHKRRLVQPVHTGLLASRLVPGGVLHCATDWPAYAEAMLAALTAEPLLVNTVDGYAPRPVSRPPPVPAQPRPPGRIVSVIGWPAGTRVPAGTDCAVTMPPDSTATGLPRWSVRCTSPVRPASCRCCIATLVGSPMTSGTTTP